MGSVLTKLFVKLVFQVIFSQVILVSDAITSFRTVQLVRVLRSVLPAFSDTIFQGQRVDNVLLIIHFVSNVLALKFVQPVL